MFNEKEIKEIEVVEEYNAEIEETVEETEEVIVAEKKNIFAEKMNLFGKKAKENAEIALQKAGEYGKISAEKSMEVLQKAGEGMQRGFADLQERINDDSYQRRMKKYNPVFMEQYSADDFKTPKMIMVVSDHERQDIDVCQGSIGWLEKQKDVNAFCIYENAVETSGMTFIPSPQAGALYYVDNFNDNKYIRTDCIFDEAYKGKLAELKHIAYCLGAKQCIIEIREESKKVAIDKKKFNAKESAKLKIGEASSTEKIEQSSSSKEKVYREGKIVVKMGGNSEPKRPTLKWFKNDETIKEIIDKRLENNNPVNEEIIHLKGSSYSTMSQKTAYEIDVAVKKLAGANVKTKVESDYLNESNYSFNYIIQF